MERVKLNVGGTVFETTLTTMRSPRSIYFYRLFSGDWRANLDKHGAIFIDRNPLVFDRILDLLRGHTIPTFYYERLLQLELDLRYYQIAEKETNLVDHWRAIGLNILIQSSSGDNDIGRILDDNNMIAAHDRWFVFNFQFGLLCTRCEIRQGKNTYFTNFKLSRKIGIDKFEEINPPYPYGPKSAIYDPNKSGYNPEYHVDILGSGEIHQIRFWGIF